MSTKVLSLGQCGADNYGLTGFLQSHFDVDIVPADFASEALALLRGEPFALVLVNRIFDANGDSGLDFISELKKDPSLANVPVMLVSNHADAQKQAVARGAVAGFGKAALRDERVADRLRPFLVGSRQS